MSARLLFVTGTDTGVGKTVLTALLTAHLRQSGVPASALKPFCSGGRGDAELLRSVQDNDLALDEINPFYFAEPLAPLVAARRHRRRIVPADVLSHIRVIEQKLAKRFKSRRPVLLVEGVGGLLVPLCEKLCVLDLILRLRCEVLVVAPNKLGTINHSLLTLRTLREAGIKRVRLVLMEPPSPDPSCRSNPRLLAELISPTPLFRLPFLRPAPNHLSSIRHHATHLAAVLRNCVAE